MKGRKNPSANPLNNEVMFDQPPMLIGVNPLLKN